MDGNNRKRKLDDEEDEEEVEKFFALITDAREAHKHIIMGGKDKTTEQQDRNKAEERKKKPADIPLWKPAFEPEDFIEVAADKQLKRRRSVIVSFPRPSSKREPQPKEEDIEEGGDRGFDLKLSL